MSRDLRILEPNESLPEPILPASPVVVVQYRRGWITTLMIPVLILITSVALLSHRVRIDDWRGLGHYLGLKEFNPPKTEPIKPEPAAAPAPPALVVTIVPQDPPALPAPSLLEPPKPLPSEVAEAPASPIVAPPIEVPQPAPGVQAREIWDDIRKESERKLAETKVLEDVKEFQLEQEQRLTEQKKLVELKRERNEAANARLSFRKGLRAALDQPEGRAGPAIRDLCAREGVTLGSSSTPWTNELVSTSAARRERVEKLRKQQFSEAMILCDLIRLENRNRVARRAGSGTPEDIVVRAARQLLLVPLTSTIPAPTAHGVARTVRPR